MNNRFSLLLITVFIFFLSGCYTHLQHTQRAANNSGSSGEEANPDQVYISNLDGARNHSGSSLFWSFRGFSTHNYYPFSYSSVGYQFGYPFNKYYGFSNYWYSFGHWSGWSPYQTWYSPNSVFYLGNGTVYTGGYGNFVGSGKDETRTYSPRTIGTNRVRASATNTRTAQTANREETANDAARSLNNVTRQSRDMNDDDQRNRQAENLIFISNRYDYDYEKLHEEAQQRIQNSRAVDRGMDERLRILLERSHLNPANNSNNRHRGNSRIISNRSSRSRNYSSGNVRSSSSNNGSTRVKSRSSSSGSSRGSVSKGRSRNSSGGSSSSSGESTNRRSRDSN